MAEQLADTLALLVNSGFPVGHTWVKQSPQLYKIILGDSLFGDKLQTPQYNVDSLEDVFSRGPTLDSMFEVQELIIELLSALNRVRGKYHSTFEQNCVKFVLEDVPELVPILEELHNDPMQFSIENVFCLLAELYDAVLCTGPLMEHFEIEADQIRIDPIYEEKGYKILYFGWDVAFVVLSDKKNNVVSETAPMPIAFSGPNLLKWFNERKPVKRSIKIPKKLLETASKMDNFKLTFQPTRLKSVRILRKRDVRGNPVDAKFSSQKKTKVSQFESEYTQKNPTVVQEQKNARAARAARRIASWERILDMHSAEMAASEQQGCSSSFYKKESTPEEKPCSSTSLRKAKKRKSTTVPAVAETAPLNDSKYVNLRMCNDAKREEMQKISASRRAARANVRAGLPPLLPSPEPEPPKYEPMPLALPAPPVVEPEPKPTPVTPVQQRSLPFSTGPSQPVPRIPIRPQFTIIKPNFVRGPRRVINPLVTVRSPLRTAATMCLYNHQGPNYRVYRPVSSSGAPIQIYPVTRPVIRVVRPFVKWVSAIPMDERRQFLENWEANRRKRDEQLETLPHLASCSNSPIAQKQMPRVNGKLFAPDIANDSDDFEEDAVASSNDDSESQLE